MKKNLENTIATLVANQLNEVKEQVSKSKTTKGQKTKKQLVEESKEAAEEFANAKLVELKPKGKKSSKKEETIKEVKQQQKPSIIEQVISNREVKYVYPEDITDTLARKKWRQQTRNELHRLEREMFRIKDQNSKEFKDAAKKYEDFKKKVLKPEQVA
nr:MAG: hypothetical protein [Bacteriophage sp.]